MSRPRRPPPPGRPPARRETTGARTPARRTRRWCSGHAEWCCPRRSRACPDCRRSSEHHVIPGSRVVGSHGRPNACRVGRSGPVGRGGVLGMLRPCPEEASRPSLLRWPKCRSRHRTPRPCCAGTGQIPATPIVPPCASATGCGPTPSSWPRPSALPPSFVARLDPARPPHVGLLLDNTPDYVFTLCGAGLAGVAVAGLNHTRVGEHLARDIVHTDVQFVITEPRHQAQLHAGHRTASTCRAGSWSPIASPTRTTRRPSGESLGRALDDAAVRVGGSTEERRLGRTRRRHPVGPAVHLRDLGRPEGGSLHAVPTPHHGQPDGHDARAHARRRRLRGHAALPHQLADVRTGSGARRRRVAVSGPPLQRLADSCPTSGTTASPGSTTPARC